jgi:hypothetical protein
VKSPQRAKHKGRALSSEDFLPTPVDITSASGSLSVLRADQSGSKGRGHVVKRNLDQGAPSPLDC